MHQVIAFWPISEGAEGMLGCFGCAVSDRSLHPKNRMPDFEPSAKETTRFRTNEGIGKSLNCSVRVRKPNGKTQFFKDLREPVVLIGFKGSLREHPWPPCFGSYPSGFNVIQRIHFPFCWGNRLPCVPCIQVGRGN